MSAFRAKCMKFDFGWVLPIPNWGSFGTTADWLESMDTVN